jgi:hypothetical protein
MDFARKLFGGSEQEHKDFVDRYQQGPRAISDEEAAARYQQVAPNLPPDVYQQSAQDVFAQMSPEQRVQLGQQLIQSARQQGHSFPDVNQDGIDDRLQDPEYLARTTTQLHQQQPGLLNQVLGSLGGGHAGVGHTGGGGGMLSSPLAKGVLGGIAAYGVSRMLGGGHHSSGHGGLFGGHHGHSHGRRHGHGGFFEGPEFEDLVGGDFGGFEGDEDD